jgi:REP element-mobilizing transposase RayT
MLGMARPRRLQGFEYIAVHRYFLTFCTSDRRRVFEDERTAAFVVTVLRHTARHHDFAVPAYCLMPDHAHVLVEGTTATSDLCRFVKRMKQRSGQLFSRQWGERLWQEGYFERVLRAGDDARAVARYILENPVRAGLVKTPADYTLLGSGVWTLSELLESV